MFFSFLFASVFLDICMLEDVSVFENDVKALLRKSSVFLSVNKILNLLTRNRVLFSEIEHKIRVWRGELSLKILESVGHIFEWEINVFTVDLW